MDCTFSQSNVYSCVTLHVRAVGGERRVYICSYCETSFAKDVGAAGIDGPLGTCHPRIWPTNGENSWLISGSRDCIGDAMPPNLSSLICPPRRIFIVVSSVNRLSMSWLISVLKFNSNSEIWASVIGWSVLAELARGVLSRQHRVQILRLIQLKKGFDQVTGFSTYCSF